MKARAVPQCLAQIPGRQLDRICLGIAVIEQRRGAIDAKMMSKGSTIQIFTGETYPLALCDFAFQAIGVEHVACQVQRRSAPEMRVDTQPVRTGAKFIDRVT